MYLLIIYIFNFLHIYILRHDRTESEIKNRTNLLVDHDQKGIRGSFTAIVNAFIMKWKKWKNLVKSYLTIPVLWAQLF